MEAFLLFLAAAIFASLAYFIYYDWKENKKTLHALACIFFIAVSFAFAIMTLVRLYI